MLPLASQTSRLQRLDLTVQVTDGNGVPVQDVPVRFRIVQTGTVDAQVDPPVVLTQRGKATTTFRARTAGVVTLEITVENLTEAVQISVLGDTPRF